MNELVRCDKQLRKASDGREPPAKVRPSALDRAERRDSVEELDLQGLMPALHLAGGSRRVGLDEQLADAVAAADPLKQHLGRACRSAPERPADRPSGAPRRTTVAITQDREWSSMPDKRFSSVPSVRNTEVISANLCDVAVIEIGKDECCGGGFACGGLAAFRARPSPASQGAARGFVLVR
jgi:hypothetical protein